MIFVKQLNINVIYTIYYSISIRCAIAIELIRYCVTNKVVCVRLGRRVADAGASVSLCSMQMIVIVLLDFVLILFNMDGTILDILFFKLKNVFGNVYVLKIQGNFHAFVYIFVTTILSCNHNLLVIFVQEYRCSSIRMYKLSGDIAQTAFKSCQRGVQRHSAVHLNLYKFLSNFNFFILPGIEACVLTFGSSDSL